MFKALFERSRNRLEYLCRWLGRPVPGDIARWDDRPIEDLLERLDGIAPDPAVAAAEADSLITTIRRYGVPLSATDTVTLRRFHAEFAAEGLELRFTSTGRRPRYYYPTLRQLILERDLGGQRAGYLASSAAWQVVKDLEDRDRVIPVVGNLAGSGAFPAIAREVTARGARVSALYVSNVEMYIWRDGTFPQFAATAARLPRDDRSLLIRSVFGGGFAQAHPRNRPPHVSTQLVQPLADFAAREARGWGSYWELVTAGNRN
jgi:hypothetical protein